VAVGEAGDGVEADGDAGAEAVGAQGAEGELGPTLVFEVDDADDVAVADGIFEADAGSEREEVS